jgi:sulfite exporter TauE/SafE
MSVPSTVDQFPERPEGAEFRGSDVASSSLRSVYSARKLYLYTGMAVVGAVLIAGFWNYHAVDGFGRDVVAGNIIGDTGELAGSFGSRGGGFGFLFAMVAGLAATFTACNCVVFAMIPGLACSTDRPAVGGSAMKALGAFVTAVLAVGAIYGIFIGFLGPEGAEAFNERAIRLAQAQAVFTTLGLAMLVWGAFELGFLDSVKRRISPVARAFFSLPVTKASLLGLMVGSFAVGRPFPVFREFLTYAATAESPIYGAGVMMIQGLGQIAVMAVLFFRMIYVCRETLTRWSRNHPERVRLTSGLALTAGGTYFVYYWGLAFAFDIGQWGFKLGWY